MLRLGTQLNLGNNMKIFNKKILVLFIIVAIIAVIFRLFLLDWIIETGFEIASGKILKTKVSIDGLHLGLTDGRLTFNRLMVLDKKNKSRSLVSLGETETKINLKALLRSQLDIELIKISGVEVGGEFIYKDNQEANEEAMKKNKKPSQLASYYEMDKISDRLNIAEITNLDSLATFKRISEASTNIDRVSAELLRGMGNSDLDDRVNQLSKDWSLLQKNQPKSVTDYADYLKQLDEVKKQLDLVNDKINERKNLVQNSYDKGTQEIIAIKKQSDTDIKTINNKIDLISSKQNNFVSEIIGDRYMAYIDKAKFVFDIIKKLKNKKSDKPSWKEKIFFKGTDIPFQIRDQKPKVLIEKILLSGWWGKKDSSNEFLAVISELTSDQRVRNKTTKLRIKSKEYSSIKRTDIFAEMDNRKDTDIISVNINSLGNPLNRSYWDLAQIPFEIISGNFGVSGNIKMVGNDFTTVLQVNTDKTKFKKDENYNNGNFLHLMLASVFEHNDKFQLTVSMRGDVFAIDSNIDELLGKEYSAFIENKKKEIKEQFQKEFDKQVRLQTASLTDQMNSAKKNLEQQFSEENKKAEAELNKISKELQKVEQAIKAEENKINKQIQSENNKIQDSINQGLKSLFK